MKATKYLDGLKNPHKARIYKTFSAEVEVKDAAKRQLTVTISTPDADRSRDTMSMKGMQYNNFIKNPVVLFAHKYDSKPIAKCLSLQITDKAAIATVEFTPKGLYEEADIIYEMYQQKFLNAWSIGFMPLDYDTNKEGGYEFKSWELFEFSSVPVPDNPNALTIMRSKGINVDKVLEGIKKDGMAVITEEGEEKDLATVTEDTQIVPTEEKETPKEEPIATEEEKTVSEETTEIKIDTIAQTKETEKPKEPEAKTVETKDVDDPTDATPITELTVGQLKDILEDVIEAGDTDDDSDGKAVTEVVKKDVQEVIALSYILDSLSWFISMFEASEVSQSSIDKLMSAMALVMQVVNEQAELGKKSFTLADVPETKDGVKLLAKAGRAISNKNKEKLKSACDHMEKAVGHVQDVMGAEDEEDNKDDGKAVAEPEKKTTPADEYLKKLAASIKASHEKVDKVTHQLKTSNQKQDAALTLLKKLQLVKGGEK